MRLSDADKSKIIFPLSPSRVIKFDRCPKSLALSKLNKVSYVAVPARVGQLVHQIVRELIVKMRLCEEKNKEMLEIIMDPIKERYQTSPYFKQLEYYFRRIVYGCGFWELFESDLATNSLCTEERIAVTSTGEAVDFMDKDAYYRGIVDMRYIKRGHLTVIDHKTGFSKFVYLDTVQLPMYAYLVSKKMKYLGKRALTGATVKIYKIAEDTTYERTMSMDQVEDVKHTLDEIVQNMYDSSFDAEPTIGNCLWCGVRSLCEEYQGLLRYYGVDELTEEILSDIIRSMVLHQSEYTKLREFAKDYFRETMSELQVDEKKYGYNPNPKVKFEVKDKKGFIEALLNLGYNEDYVWKNLSVKSALVNRAEKVLPRRILLRYGDYKAESSLDLKGYAPGGEDE